MRRTWTTISPANTPRPAEQSPTPTLDKDRPARPIVFLSDYGLDDEFVGLVHRVVARIHPGVKVIDLTHRIPPHDIRGGALTLWRCAPWIRDSVVLAVVDPGVGTSRRPVALEVAEARTVLVGPDNGLLLPAAQALGTITSAVEVTGYGTEDDPGREITRGATFDGRDLFAPVAARLAVGSIEVAEAGRPLDPGSLSGEPVARPLKESSGSLLCEVLWVDRFGNAQLNARLGDLPAGGAAWTVQLVGAAGAWSTAGTAKVVRAFAELAPGELGLVVDAYGLLALAFNVSAAAELLRLGAGDAVHLVPGHAQATG